MKIIAPAPSDDPASCTAFMSSGRSRCCGMQHLHRAAARLERLERAALPDPAALLLEQLADRRAELHLVVAGAVDVAAAAEHPCPRALLGAERLEPLAAALDDVRHVAQRLDVVHDGRLAVEALDRRERRLEPRLTAKPLQRLDQGRLLTADVCARAAVDDDVAVETAAEDVLADVAAGARLLDRALEQEALVVVLTADVDEGGVRPAARTTRSAAPR